MWLKIIIFRLFVYFSSSKDLPSWDLFKTFPMPLRDGSMRNNHFFVKIIWTIKVLVYGLLFVIVLFSAIAAKSAVLFATSQLRKNQLLPYCNNTLGRILMLEMRAIQLYLVQVYLRCKSFQISNCEIFF